MHRLQKWEYMLVDSRHLKSDELSRLLNKLGDEGWEIAGCGNESPNAHRVYLKRARDSSAEAPAA